MKDKVWIRTCQECGLIQITKPIEEWKSDKWKNVKCKNCKSIGLDYGHWEEKGIGDAKNIL